MVVDHAAKNRRMCQQRNRAVASKALKNEAPGRRRGANLEHIEMPFVGAKIRQDDARIGGDSETLVGHSVCALKGLVR